MKKKMKFLVPILFIAIVILNGCYNDSIEVLYPELSNMCDTTNVTYSKNVSKIISTYCGNCHGASYKTDGGTLRLDNYDDLMISFTDVLAAVNHTTNKPMPKNGNKLSDCIIRQLEIWDAAGKPNN